MADPEYDLAIVGGGITGTLLAYHFCRLGYRCIMLERGQVGRGSTSHSTALLQVELDTHMQDLAARYGSQAATLAYASTRQSLFDIEEIVGLLGDSCGFSERTSLYLASDPEDVAVLEREQLYREQRGFDSLILNQEELEDQFRIRADGGLLSTIAGQLDAGLFTVKLIDYLKGKGLTVQEGVEVKGVAQHGSHVLLDTYTQALDTIGRVLAGHIVIAAGYEALKYIDAKALPITTNRTYMVDAYCPQLRAPESTLPLLWETARPYFYMRPTTQPGHIILGGADVALEEGSAFADGLEVAREKLVTAFHRYLPGYTLEVEDVRSGVFVESEDGLPILTRLKNLSKGYTLLGSGGNGILFSLWAARALARCIKTGSDPSMVLLSPTRFVMEPAE